MGKLKPMSAILFVVGVSLMLCGCTFELVSASLSFGISDPVEEPSGGGEDLTPSP